MTLIEKRDHGIEHTGNVDEPWLTRGSITFLDNTLTKDMVAIEYGCGVSTIWYAQRVKHLISIEHEKSWYDRIYKYLLDHHVKNVDLRYIDICNGYVEVIDNMGKFNFIFIDGRRRSECIKHAYTHIHMGGYLLLDNSERERYQNSIQDYLSNWKRYDFHNTIWLTSLFQRDILQKEGQL